LNPIQKTVHIENGLEVETVEVVNLILRWLMMYGEDWVDLERVVRDDNIALMERNVLYLHSYICTDPESNKMKLTPKGLAIINHGLQIKT
jgi:hypothetical protein